MFLLRVLAPLILSVVTGGATRGIGEQDGQADLQMRLQGLGGEPQWVLTADEHKPERPPHWPPKVPHHKVENKTIYEVLESSKRFTKLLKFVNLNNETIYLLNDTSSNITFFAIPNWAFPHHHNHTKHSEEEELEVDHEDFDTTEDAFLFPWNDNRSELPNVFSVDEVDDSLLSVDLPKKGVFPKLVAAVLSYHVLPEALTKGELAENSTFATKLVLKDGSLGGQPFRLHVSHKGPVLEVNHHSKVLPISIKTNNGIIHVISRPLLPPPSIFQELFFASVGPLSTLSSALQRTNVSSVLEWRYIHKTGERGSVQGNPVVSFFAPLNTAFRKLPRKLQLYLFSPFGERALRKLLQYHTVPDLILHSDYLYNASAKLTDVVQEASSDKWSESPLAMQSLLLEPHQVNFGMRPREPRSHMSVATPEISHSGLSLCRAHTPLHDGPPSAPPPPHLPRVPPRPPPPPPPHPDRCGVHPPGMPGFHSNEQPYIGFRARVKARMSMLWNVLASIRSTPEHQDRLDVQRFQEWFTSFDASSLKETDDDASKLVEIDDFGMAKMIDSDPSETASDVDGEASVVSGDENWVLIESDVVLAEAEDEDGTLPWPPPGRRPGRRLPPRKFPRPPLPPRRWPQPPPPEPGHGGPSPPEDGRTLPHLPHPVPVYSYNLTVPTLLTNHTLEVSVTKYECKLRLPLPHHHATYFTLMRVNGVVVHFGDIPARNGAVHVVDRLLHPWKKHKRHHRHHHHHVDEGEDASIFDWDEDEGDLWEDWEEWLPQWAATD